jgi:hypothetical protein
MKLMLPASFALVLHAAVLCLPATAVTVGYLEDFTTGDAGWRGLATSQLVDHEASGGVNDGAFIKHIDSALTPAGNFVASSTPGGPSGAIIFRANNSASGGAFTGNYLAADVTNVYAYVKHDFTEIPIDFYLRLPGAIPGQAAVFFGDQAVPASSGWTRVNFEISPANFSLAGSPGTTFESVLANVPNFQLGAAIYGTPTPAGAATNIHFGLDQVLIVPEPSSMFLVFAAVCSALAWGRKRFR